jgi:hypothetical protein
MSQMRKLRSFPDGVAKGQIDPADTLRDSSGPTDGASHPIPIFDFPSSAPKHSVTACVSTQTSSLCAKSNGSNL